MKRLIFSLLYNEGYFILSRNFNRQRIGNLNWLMSNYNFKEVSYGLDEILLLNISENPEYDKDFNDIIQNIAQNCFIPLTVGGKIDKLSIVDEYFKNGADKIFVNRCLFKKPQIVNELSEKYGKQAIVAGINFTIIDDIIYLCDNKGIQIENKNFIDHLHSCIKSGVGELVLQSVSKDGTGNGLDLNMVKFLPHDLEIPIIAMGGIGKADHIIEGLKHPALDGVATANLLNFIGQSFVNIRNLSIQSNVQLPEFDHDIIL